ncbi:hypothetical protein [Polaribacter tangerinus]|uniref:hypothetical protein n=1 Tax=Polaribacter tangerinus TaxID=1920034 RepID=UPI000B4BC179|nr:hypothetical protein [Polaribacter tangerinus]
MANKLSISNRINIGLALTIVFLLVLATNRIDKRHFETVQETLTTMHKDRVLAQDYVYKMSDIVHKKRLFLIDSNSVFNKTISNKQFETLIDVFATTKLTVNESKTFISLQENFQKLKAINQKKGTSFEEENMFLQALETDLNNLSIIQVSESQNLMSVAQKSLDNNNLISNIEIGFLILIGAIIQFTIFYKFKKDISKTENKY